jgi:formylglycine-generating enzyme required for sulfatase activity
MRKERVGMMKSVVASLLAVSAAVGFSGEISVSDVAVSQDSSTRLVTVSYTLGSAEAIVTVDFMTNCVSVVSEDPYVTVTNAVSIGAENFVNVEGDVNRLVTGAGRHTITWQPMDTWPDRALGRGVVVASVTARAKDDPPDYMVVSLVDEDTLPRISYYVSTNALPEGGLANDAYRTSRLVMRRIHAAGVRWRMGAVDSDYSGTDYKLTAREQAHGVTLSEDYFIGIYEVTQAQGAKFGGKGAAFTGYEDSPLRPSSDIPYESIRGSGTGNGHAVKSGSALYKLRRLTDIDFDLPTSAQWEFACRAGTDSLLYTGKKLSNANVYELGWIYGNSEINGARTAQVVGQKLPNAWGLYDMLGNSREWCLDWYGGVPSSADVVDPIGPATGSNRILRGGDYSRSISDFRPASSYYSWDIEDRRANQCGYRLMCPVALKFE